MKKPLIYFIILLMAIGLSACSNSQFETLMTTTTQNESAKPLETPKPTEIQQTVPKPTETSTLTSIERSTTEPLETPTPTEIQSWQNAYIQLLQEYKEKNGRLHFLLYDFDKDNIAELVVVGTLEDEVYSSVFKFRDGNVVSLDYGEDIRMADIILYARGGVTTPPNNSPGLINYVIGASAGSFGTNRYYTKIVIDGDKLIVSDTGTLYIDVETLSELFEDFGRNTTDDVALSDAIEKYTYYYLNDKIVSKEELDSVFEHNMSEDLSTFSVTESNINEGVFNWLPY